MFVCRDLFEREELVRREHEGKVEALKLELTERESEMREESRAVCSELNTDLDRMRTGNANKLTERYRRERECWHWSMLLR